MGSREIYFFFLFLLTGVPCLLLLAVSIGSFGRLRIVSGIVWLMLASVALLFLLLRIENPEGTVLTGLREFRFPWARIGLLRQFLDGAGFSAAAGVVAFFMLYRLVRRRESGATLSFWVGVLIFAAASIVLGASGNFAGQPDTERLWHWLGVAVCSFGVYQVWQTLAGFGEWEREGALGFVFGCFLLVFSLASVSHAMWIVGPG
jgi:hypothetical protein